MLLHERIFFTLELFLVSATSLSIFTPAFDIFMISSSAKDTITYAQEFLETVTSGIIVALVGDLGSGKTTFVQGIAGALGVVEPVTSPTFVLWHQYETKNGSFPFLHHLDLYRLESEKEVFDLGLQELFSQPDGLVIVEWADKFESLFPEQTVWVTFRYVDEETREIEIENAN